MVVLRKALRNCRNVPRRAHPGTCRPWMISSVALVLKADIHAAREQEVLNGKVNFLRALRTEVTDWAVHQLEAGFDGVFTDFLYFRAA